MWTSQGRAWYAALMAERLQTQAEPGEYEALTARIGIVPTSELDVIDKDLGRTFPDRAEFQTAAKRAALRRVLGARRRVRVHAMGLDGMCQRR